MRKSNFILAGIVALTVGLTGCSNEDYDMPQGSPKAGMLVSFSAEKDSEFKKIVYGDVSEGKTELKWVAGDKVVIYSPSSAAGASTSQQGIYSAKSSAPSTDFDYSATAGFQSITWATTATQSFYSLYPGNTGNAAFASDQLSVTIPAAPNYAASETDGMENVLMYAKALNVDIAANDYIALNYNHIPTVLEVEFPGNSKVITSIEVTATGADANKIAGTFSAAVGDADANNPTEIAFWNAQSATGKADKITVIPPANFKSDKLYIAVAPYAFTGLTVKFIAEDFTAELVRSSSIEPRKLYKVTKSDDLVWEPIVVTPPVGGGGTATTRTDVNSVDMGIWVVSSPDANNAIRTEWISNGVVAWDVNINTGIAIASSTTDPASKSGAKRLYFATGNLHVSADPEADLTAGKWGIIAPVTSIELGNGMESGYGSDAKGYGLYGWGDPLGSMTSTDGDHYPLNDGDYTYTTRPQHISGSKWDIAKHQLGDAWRLPTAVEWAFLLETSNAMRTEGISYTSTGGYGSTYSNPTSTITTNAPWQSADTDKRGYLITSNTTDESIFLPALGNRSSSWVGSRGSYGFYWSGSFYSMSNACYFIFDSSSWTVSSYGRNDGFAVRPVSEL